MTCPVEGCGKPIGNGGYCYGHYWRLYKHGSVYGGGTSPGAAMEFIRNAATYSEASCLPWPYAKTAAGYGVVTFEGKQTTAHRAALTVAVGPPPSPQHQAAHAPGICHNTSCVNPSHLRWATPEENSQDKREDGTILAGERSPKARLSSSQVLAIRSDERSHRTIAADYGVAESTIQMIKNGTNWRHL